MRDNVAVEVPVARLTAMIGEREVRLAVMAEELAEKTREADKLRAQLAALQDSQTFTTTGKGE